MPEYKSEKNLQAAFAGESQASRRYTFFAEKADKEKQPQIARLFRAAAAAETVHAYNHMSAMDGIGSTKENVMAASVGEHYEFTRMYPPFIEEAEREKNERAVQTFEWANQVEQIHHKFFEAALKALNDGKPIKEQLIFVCQGCGNTVEGAAPDVCPICGAPKSMFKRID
jgi:rubrerythrin